MKISTTPDSAIQLNTFLQWPITEKANLEKKYIRTIGSEKESFPIIPGIIKKMYI